MTLQDIIDRVDLLKPNRFTRPQKCAWLGQIESQLWEEVIKTHHMPFPNPQPHIDQHSDPDTKLIAPDGYCDLYLYWLESQIDLNNMEIQKYNNSKALFNNAYLTYQAYVNRNFMPRQRVTAFKFDDHRHGPHPHHLHHGHHGLYNEYHHHGLDPDPDDCCHDQVPPMHNKERPL